MRIYQIRSAFAELSKGGFYGFVGLVGRRLALPQIAEAISAASREEEALEEDGAQSLFRSAARKKRLCGLVRY